MRYLCLLAVFLLLPLGATAEQRRDDRRSNDRGSDQRQSDRRNADRGDSDRRGSDQRDADRHRPDSGKSPSNPQTPWWEQQRTPWWERQGPPSWEQQKKEVPAWQTWNPARTILDRQKEEQQRREHGARRPIRRGSSSVYVVPAYPFYPSPPPPVAVVETVTVAPPQIVTQAPLPPPLASGILRLEVEPKDLLQIYIDDVYVGTPADLGDELELIAGARRIELRARGYRTVTFTAEITDGRTITYRAQLDRDERTPPPPVIKPAPIAPTTMYVIPGCYLGNVAPKASELRAGCDLSKLTTFVP